MLLRSRPPGIPKRPPDPADGFEHLDPGWLAVLRWLCANRVDYVLVGAAAEAVRGASGAAGPVAIVPAPYRRNYERLAAALWSARSRLRIEGAQPPQPSTVPVKLTAEKLARGGRWTLRCGAHDVDIEGDPAPREQAASRYQELVYETTRTHLAAGVTVEVASVEDIEHYKYVRDTGLTPEIRILRQGAVRQDTT